ncbi:MAG: DPP IV N-terminal domain-containing protein [Legionella sp.]|uniref:S9 family peptidase n=1 Tax=Legionella sp. TaxID=459 RepID=UPI00283F787C|nr:DPP IV N-terminal domain-containing protein [Legionella sp.]
MDAEALYQQAESFLPWNLHRNVFNSTIVPYWTKDALYYFQQTQSAKSLLRVDIQTGKKEFILGYDKLLNELFLQTNSSSEQSLSAFSIKEKPEQQLFFIHNNYSWSYRIKSGVCECLGEIIPARLNSPDKAWAFQVKEHNIFFVDLLKNQEFRITKDGELYYDYATSPETNTHTISHRIQKITPQPIALWSPNSKKIITHKLDQRKVKELFLLENAPKDSQRPRLHSYRMSFSGDENLPLTELMIVDVDKKATTPINISPLLAPYLTPIEFKWVWWDTNNQNAFFIKETRGAKELMLYEIDTTTGDTKLLLIEKAEQTYVEPNPHSPWAPQVILLEDSQQFIWLSERDGYAHLYLFEKGRTTPMYAITKGEWCVREVLFYNKELDLLYFTACGYDVEADPYHNYLYRCRLDGSEMHCITTENANHNISISPQKNCFLDTYSTIDTAPVMLLKNMSGDLITQVEVADIAGLTELNWVPPQRFCATARDGATEIYGNLYFPSYFDSSKKYPVIDHIYPGPQMFRTPIDFNLYSPLSRSAWTAQALAELGFIVIQIDGFGTPGRSKAFHDATYQNMGDCGIPDHITAIKQLASRYSYMDIERVGITGYSGGGYAAMRAMLLYPDFYQVCVSAAGNHDLRCYPASYGEKYNSLDTTTYPEQSNVALAERLQGKVLLIHGEMDDNVHPCATIQLVDALIKHNKDFDLVIMPNQNHSSTSSHPYYIRKTWDFFVQHHLEITPPQNYRLKEMSLNFTQII